MQKRKTGQTEGYSQENQNKGMIEGKKDQDNETMRLGWNVRWKEGGQRSGESKKCTQKDKRMKNKEKKMYPLCVEKRIKKYKVKNEQLNE